jgi:hypothetical protein
MIGLPLVVDAFAAISEAHSADLSVPPLTPAADFSGWYLRGRAYDDPPRTPAAADARSEGNWPSTSRGRLF